MHPFYVPTFFDAADNAAWKNKNQYAFTCIFVVFFTVNTLFVNIKNSASNEKWLHLLHNIFTSNYNHSFSLQFARQSLPYL
jgi:hypothetical protein